MSLINDALKRAKDAQPQNPPPAGGPALKPAEAATEKSASNAKSLLYIMVACVVFGNALLFFAVQKKKEAPLAIPTQPAATVAPAVAVATPAPPTAKAEPAPGGAAIPTPVAAPVEVETNSVAAAPVAAVPPEPPKPAPLKLQSIMFNPSRPSAVVSGKFLLVGDKVQGFRVTAIEQEMVTLVGNGQTNVLSLP